MCGDLWDMNREVVDADFLCDCQMVDDIVHTIDGVGFGVPR